MWCYRHVSGQRFLEPTPNFSDEAIPRLFIVPCQFHTLELELNENQAVFIQGLREVCMLLT